ncbi:bifunctional hydroxymethylpyrimidine kinase/phosphomethylpyrimidine kinase [Gracilibacillus alcaliphilus]|uniref:bifunctional hydroxymethylpyrimidine kinase/phosphomethylpyrimidine kinase n=1 Tax=Gracilibacillus alcaliphilus TaxID=1401441 RepID=UPI00195E3493|nr:bifunctional hydroxymethylpyrimidine kinase/phosphomethylpyrimidine kinase [Gracilibacillus alcaliphilus]MBM7677836.1 hydroxymethylpyrimidine/phosphomethylpyrimidine kinase [Gracilibacillus alcaliphilus]
MSSTVSALTIAGTDPTGGAGIQADLKAFQEREVYGMSVITSVVAQNTLGVQDIQHLSLDFIEKQLEVVFEDISPQAIKTGMVATVDMMELIAEKLKRENKPYVIDPVMVATSGDSLMDEATRQVIRNTLLPLATVVTPNIPEAEILAGFSIADNQAAEEAAKVIVDELGAQAVVIKGGHLSGAPTDILYDGISYEYLTAKRFKTKHTHGTGCTFSAVITAELAKGKQVKEAVQLAKAFITDAIQYPLELGKGNGPTNHWGYRLQGLPFQREE